MSVDNSYQHIKDGGKWLELSEEDIIELVNFIRQTAFEEGIQSGLRAGVNSNANKLLEAETQRVILSNQALAETLANPPELIVEEA